MIKRHPNRCAFWAIYFIGNVCGARQSKHTFELVKNRMVWWGNEENLLRARTIRLISSYSLTFSIRDNIMSNLGYAYLKNNEPVKAYEAFHAVAAATLKSTVGLALAHFKGLFEKNFGFVSIFDFHSCHTHSWTIRRIVCRVRKCIELVSIERPGESLHIDCHGCDGIQISRRSRC